MKSAPVDMQMDNPAYGAAAPDLSILIPFFRYDPSPLVRALDCQSQNLTGAVELVLLDDGSRDIALTAEIQRLIQGIQMPARLVTLADNVGRAAGRNRLFRESRARHILFIDCDMAPDRPAFLETWLELVQYEDPAIAFGGFSLDQVQPDIDQRLHYALQKRGECVSAVVRRRTPEKYVYTSNLLVRRDVFETERFDDSFAGWGWEDVEWGIRISSHFDIAHIDNPATHLGLDSEAVLLDKYGLSLSNFTRILSNHPDVIKTYPSYRLSRVMRQVPHRNTLVKLLRRVAQSGAPLFARIVAAKLYRAAIYAEAIP